VISIVIPVYNEEENVQPLFRKLEETMDELNEEYEVLFVDDGSTDQTLFKLKELIPEANKKETILRIIELRKNFTKTPALLAAFANINEKAETVITMDGDLQNDPKDIPMMLDALTEDVDVVCGWRKNRKDTIFKKWPSKLSNFLNRKLNNISIHDSGCALRVYRREAVDGLKLYTEGHRYLPTILARKGFRITEVVVHHHAREKGKSKYGVKRLGRGFVDLMTLRFLHKWGVKPGHFFSYTGLVFLFLGFLSGIWLLLEKYIFWLFWDKYTWNYSIGDRPLLILTILLLITGFQFLLNGFIAELIIRGTRDPKESYSIRKEWK
jgi:glycosyltransferase involved in cell wall biosynthesis